MDIEVVLDAGAIIGESPTWADCGKGALLDRCEEARAVSIRSATGGQRSWPMPSDIGAFCLYPSPPGAVVALREGIFRLDFATGSLTMLAPPPFDPELFRFNEGACDAAGRFWVGVMFDPLKAGAPPQKSSLHSFSLEAVCVPNLTRPNSTTAWLGAADGALFYLTHSLKREIFTFAFDAESGRIGDRAYIRAACRTRDGLPDGAAVDDRGGYWCALHGGGRLRRYTADGRGRSRYRDCR